MENNLIMFGSITLAMRARDILNINRINTRLIRTPARLRNKSCGYSLIVFGNLEFALELLNKNNIATLGVAAVDLR